MRRHDWRWPLLLPLAIASTLLISFEREPSRAAGSKVEIPGHLLKSATPAVQTIVSKAQSPEAEIPAGTKLLALVDNDCLNSGRHGISDTLKASRALSKKARQQSKIPVKGEMRVQAYAFSAEQPLSLSSLALDADQDACVLKVTSNEYQRLLDPPDSSAYSSAYSSATLSAQAVLNDPRLSELVHLKSLKSQQAWSTFYSKSLGISGQVLVAVVDSGIDYRHEDLAPQMWKNAAGQFGYDFVNGDNDPLDDYYHGTHVAGLIGAVANNRIGVAGVMGSNIRIMAVKSIDKDGGATEAHIANGIMYAADQGAQVINMSFGGGLASVAVREAMKYAAGKGAVLVSAAGNDGKLVSTTFPVTPSMYSAAIPGAISVASLDTENGAFSSFSNYSNTLIHIIAPGAVSSSGRTGLLSTAPDNTYYSTYGTSMSAPLVSGAAALTISLTKRHGANYSNAEILSFILYTSRKESAFTTQVKDGATLDLSRLARYLRYSFMIEGDAGTEMSE